MDLLEAVTQRKSIRAFKPDPVPVDTLKHILGLAVRAPSWSNTQPWDFYVAGGKRLQEIETRYTERAEQNLMPDIARPEEFPEPYSSRRIGSKLLDAKGIKREDKTGRRRWRIQGEKHFGAPAVVYVCTGRTLYFQRSGINAWPMFDCGLVSENIALLAVEHGLGTIIQAQAVNYPDILRDVLGIPDSKLVVVGISIGYPDWNDPINRIDSEREPLDSLVQWQLD